jgi:hypothetical protein
MDIKDLMEKYDIQKPSQPSDTPKFGKRRVWLENEDPLVKSDSTIKELTTKWQQTDNKVATNRQQSGNKPTTLKSPISETGNKVATEPATQVTTKWQQTDNKVATKASFSSLVGLQRALTIFLYECCKASGSRVTNSLTLEHISTCLKTSSGSVKTTLQRLEGKGLISRVAFKNGRAGWSKYELPETHYRELLQTESGNKLTTKWQQTDNKVGTEPATELATRPSSSSSILNIKNLTTTEPIELEWQKIHLGPAEGLGLSRYYISRAKELYPNLDPISVQRLVYGFERHLVLPENKKAIRNPGAFFLSLAEKLSKGESPLPEYKTPDDDLIEKIQATASAKHQIHQERLNALQSTLFENWWYESSLEEKTNLVPAGPIKGNIYKSAVRTKWLEEIWPDTNEAKSIGATL